VQLLRRLWFFLVVRLLPLAVRRWLLLRPYRRAHRLLSARRRPQEGGRDEELQRTLTAILSAHRNTEFGRAHGFERIADLKQFGAQVPLRRFSEIEPFMRRELDGERQVLVADEPLGVARDQLHGRIRLALLTGQSFEQWRWVEQLVTYATLERRPQAALGRWLQLLPAVLHGAENEELDPEQLVGPPELLLAACGGVDPAHNVVPHQLFGLIDAERRYYLILRLALAEPVTVLRAACPGTLTILAEQLEQQAERLLDDLSCGTMAAVDLLPQRVQLALGARPLRPRPRLAARLERLRRSRGRLEPRHVWPRLCAVVCQTAGPGRAAAERLPDRFGEVAIVDEGLRGAEGILTLPGGDSRGGQALIWGQVLEFLAVDSEGHAGGAALPPSALERGGRYRPVLTSQAGLYRYELDELVEVTDLEGGVPRLAQAGRRPTLVSIGDSVLDEVLVRRALQQACRAHDLVLVEHTSWVQPPAPAPAEPEEAVEESWWSRLLSRAGLRSSRARARQVALAWALELEQEIDQALAQKLLQSADDALRKSSAAYAAQRDERRIDGPLLLVLARGTFARRRYDRLAAGWRDGHAPATALREVPMELEAEEIQLSAG